VPAVRQNILLLLWRGIEPFAGFPTDLYQLDIQGWGSTHRFLTETIIAQRPQVVVEIGVWKGASVITMAAKLRELELDGVVIAVDTWLGSWDHWLNDAWFPSLGMELGRPALQRKFMTNVIAAGLAGHVVPLPLDSLNAMQVLAHRGIRPDIVHIDGAHDFQSVWADLNAWWALLRPGGVLIGDDYHTDGLWPDVRRAFDVFAAQRGGLAIEADPPKCRLVKPEQG